MVDGIKQRKTFSGFVTNFNSGKVESLPLGQHDYERVPRVETRGRFLIERDDDDDTDLVEGLIPSQSQSQSQSQFRTRFQSKAESPTLDIKHHCTSPSRLGPSQFALRDHLKSRHRKSIGWEECQSDWRHLGEAFLGIEREFPRMEPLVIRSGQLKRSAELPTGIPNNHPLNINSSSLAGNNRASTLARKALTSLLPTKHILHLVKLAIIDEEEVRACLILHVAFGLELPDEIIPGRKYTVKMPDFQGGSLSPSHLKKISNNLLLNRIFLMALDKRYEKILLMLLKADFPREPFDPIFTVKPKSTSLKRYLPSYFYLAVLYKLNNLVKIMLEKASGTDVNEANWLGITPLLLANLPESGGGKKASTLITRLLLAAGANPTIGIPITDVMQLKMGRYGKPRLSVTATTIIPTTITTTPTTATTTSPSTSVSPFTYYLHPIDLACANENCEAVILLLAAHQQHQETNMFRYSRLLLVQSNLDITIRLIKAGADVNTRNPYDDRTPLHYAARLGKVDVLAVLLHAGANINAISRSGNTPLYEAAAQGHAAAIKFLISRGADCSLVNVQGETALQAALRHRISAEDIIDYFHSQDLLLDQSDDEQIDALLTQVDGFELSSEIDSSFKGKGGRKRQSKRRFLIEKIVSLPRWLSGISGNSHSNGRGDSHEGICK